MKYAIILFIFFTVVKAIEINYPKIYGHFRNGTIIEICTNNQNDCTDVADSYTIGEGDKEFLVWTPFGTPGIAGEHVGIILAKALRDIIVETRIGNKDTIKGRIKVVDWSEAAYTTICEEGNPNSECPTVLILGTTQFAYRSKRGDIKILDSYFDKYLNDTHEPLTDSFLKQVYYDYNIDSHFMAVPLILDIRLLYFNRTTFDTLNLEYPPPYGNSWGSYSKPYYDNWNWEKFVQYIQRIKSAYPNDDAFSFTGQYDEEMKLFHMIIRNYFIETIDENKTCGYLNNKEKLLEIIDSIIKPIFSQLGDKWYPDSDETKSFLNNSTYIPPEELPIICCRNTSEYSNGFLGLTIDSPNSMRKVQLYGKNNPTGEIAAGYVPGSTSYLGGSGIAISNHVSKELQDIAWAYILKLINTSDGYLTDIGKATNMMPPYDSLFDIKYWDDEKWDIPKNQIRHSLQIQYPRQTFPEFGELEDRHVIRLMLLEILKKNVEPSLAVERCCKLMNNILSGKCSDEHWTYTFSKCTSFNNKKVMFSWINNSCKDGISLPKDITISCSHITFSSGIGGSMTVFSILGIIISVIYMLLFIKYKNTEPIKKAPLNFSLIAIFGSILNYASVILSTGYPYEYKCVLNKWFLILGISLAFGGFSIKLKKVYEIYKSRELNRQYIGDGNSFKMIIGLVMFNVIALIFWTIYNTPLSNKIIKEEQINTRIISYDIIKCSNPREQNLITLFFIYIFNFLILFYGLWLSFKSWTIPQSYSETKFVCTSIFISALAIFIAIPLVWFSYSEEVNYLIKSLILNFSTAVAISVFCLPKIRAAYYYSKILYKKKDSNELLTTDKLTRSVCCPNCGALISSNLN